MCYLNRCSVTGSEKKKINPKPTGLSVFRQVCRANLLTVTYFIERIPKGSLI